MGYKFLEYLYSGSSRYQQKFANAYPVCFQ